MTDLPHNVEDWSKYWRETYEERAAIMQHDGGLNQKKAEFQAEELVRAEYQNLIGVSFK